MKAMVLREPGKPFVEEEYPDPEPGPGEAVAKVLACGAGLTIHHARMGRVPGVEYPLVIGHEITGVITAVGAGAEGLGEGDAVTAYFYVTCGACKWCRVNRETLCENFAGYVGRQAQGAYAEYIKLPARNFLKLPAGLDHEKNAAEVSVICDAIATPYKVTKRARIAPTETVAVMGAGGGVGIHMVMMAKWAHASVIAVDVEANKLGKCRDVGADEAVDASRGDVAGALLDLTGGGGRGRGDRFRLLLRHAGGGRPRAGARRASGRPGRHGPAVSIRGARSGAEGAGASGQPIRDEAGGEGVARHRGAGRRLARGDGDLPVPRR